MTDVLVLRPQADFARVDALPPASLSVSYHAPDGAEVPEAEFSEEVGVAGDGDGGRDCRGRGVRNRAGRYDRRR